MIITIGLVTRQLKFWFAVIVRPQKLADPKILIAISKKKNS